MHARPRLPRVLVHKSPWREPVRTNWRQFKVLDDLLRRHDGVITGVQAREAGLGQDAIERRVQSGHWRRCARGVFFVDDRPFTDAARIRAAVWSNGERAAASGLAAAWWIELTKYAPKIVEVTVPRVSNHIQRPGLRLRRRDLSHADVTERRGLRVTTLPLTVLEAAVRPGGGRSCWIRRSNATPNYPRFGRRICETRADMALRPRADCFRPRMTAPDPKPNAW